MLPREGLVLCCGLVLASLIFLNAEFYRFLYRKRGGAFILAAIPFHVLYHFHNGLAFAIGSTRYAWRTLVHERICSADAERLTAGNSSALQPEAPVCSKAE
jgi:hypothetical protein